MGEVCWRAPVMTLVAVLFGCLCFALVGFASFSRCGIVDGYIAVFSVTGFSSIKVVALVIFGGQDPCNRSDVMSVVDVHDSHT